ncbi:photosystem I assembly protein Ycf3 [Anatilimnocola aggregata]|uniref:Photosystem I assembly protein Ycf3 n=1 Tax=Anatilimnocola aggregata TaxID=2528021 RepID=A0A517YGM2_9BACT|nr:tetratricopeptide repeat protein [Anatilimnocola aggregata]QDU29383.1 photosystem I assembly protein Ycf3 [Anatilimnocola aggregata]
MKKYQPSFGRRTLRFVATCTLLVCALNTGCKSPWGWWGSGSGGTGGMFSSATPDVGKQKYDGLSQDFSSGAGGAYQQPKATSGNYVSNAWNKSTAAVGSVFAWKGTKSAVPTDDPTSLDSKTKAITPDILIAAGRMYETKGKFPEALQQYEKALKVAPNDLASLISIGRLYDRQGNFPKAIETYNRAAAAHPKSGLVQNDLGLCYARQKDAARAVEHLTMACERSPKDPKYRNNLATVLVENGRTEEAFRHLKALNSEGAAHYNLAYLLVGRGKQEEAAQHLRLALQVEPELSAARELLAQMGGVPEQNVQQPYAQVNAQQPMDQRQQALSLFQAGPVQRTAPTGQSPFQQASQTTSNPVEIVFPTAPANTQQPPSAPTAFAAPQPTAYPQQVPAAQPDGSYRIADDETPQLLPPVTE